MTIQKASERYQIPVRLLLEEAPSDPQRFRMLEEKRSAALDVIHFKEHPLQRLDDLRHEIRKSQTKTGGAGK